MTDHARRTAADEPVTQMARSRRLRTGAHRQEVPAPRAGGFRRPLKALALAVAALTVVGGIATAAILPGVNGPGLAAVGPVSATDGFPVWYKDKNGLRLENCISNTDPFCPAFGALPDPSAPISFPDNYPDEGFYSLTSANLSTGNGGKALLAVALEQAFRSGPVVSGDQVTFARMRLKLTNAQDGVPYTFTTPVGTKTMTTSGKVAGLVFDTEDIGIGGQGDFSGALGGRVGPFLTWDTFPGDPALKPDPQGKDTYVGDGGTLHKITGSPYGAASNVFRIEGPGINPSPTVDACPTVTGPISDCIETNLFTVQGKLATTSGVTAEQATYSRTSGGANTVDVYASSETGPQAIQVSDVSSGGAKFDPTGLTGSNGHFLAHVTFSGNQPPTQVQVVNTGDVPASSKTISVVDRVTGKATYDTDSQFLNVTAASSDAVTAPALTVTGFGSVTGGTYTSSQLDAPPVSVTVTSAAGGSVTLPVDITGKTQAPIPAVAQAGPDQTVSTGQLVTLDGSSSNGATSYSWTADDANNPAPITLTNPGSATPTFTPTVIGTYKFSLAITGPGNPAPASVTVTVSAPSKAVANAGPAQTVQRGTKVTLDGSASTGAASYTWTQVLAAGDPTATLTGANTAKPTFTFPLYKAPATNNPLTFNLHVTSGDGSFSDAVVKITPTNDTVTIAKALYTASKKEWRIDGTSSILGGQFVTVHIGPLTGPVIGTPVLVDATGAWSVRVTSAVVGTAGQTVSAESQLGGTVAGVAVRVQ